VTAWVLTHTTGATRTRRLQQPRPLLPTRPGPAKDASSLREAWEVRELRREVEIAAPPEDVWVVVSDFAAYPEWNPFIRRIEGELRKGARLEVQIEPPGARATTFKPTVQAVDTNHELRWLGRLLLPGVIDGEHSLRIETLDGGRSRFIQSERFTGVLVGLVRGTLAKTEVGFEQMNTALKARVEDASPPR
jgi:hypothetical protein